MGFDFWSSGCRGVIVEFCVSECPVAFQMVNFSMNPFGGLGGMQGVCSLCGYSVWRSENWGFSFCASGFTVAEFLP